jgi:hypothetical protein
MELPPEALVCYWEIAFTIFIFAFTIYQDKKAKS